MACVVVTTIGALGAVVAKKVAKNREDSNNINSSAKIPWSQKLGWLAMMLGFGSLLLIFEHVWHGEIVPWFPFLTAMSDAEATSEMLREMAIVGGSMTFLILCVWAIMVVVSDKIALKNTSRSAE